ncbi:MAG: Orotate phosphoribosyltransferase [Chlamydiae bacterium]|nr:Orotate phosphoribosyltransferase [Chlamydiota bacterium]
MEIESCVCELYEIGAVKFGEFRLKSGILSPIYIDFRLLVSYPKLLKRISELIWERVSALPFDRMCGVPYTALPIATALSIEKNIPMVMRRKEAKSYGTQKIIEGDFAKGENCLVIEDLITSGLSIFETLEPLEDVGLKVDDIVVILDRQQGGRAKVEQKGYRVHSLLTMQDLLRILADKEKISPETVENVENFIAENQC